MIYSRLILLATAAGISGYLYESFPNVRPNFKTDFPKHDHLNACLRALYAHLSDHMYESITTNYRSNLAPDDDDENVNGDITAVDLISQFKVEDDTPVADRWFARRVPIVPVATTGQLLDCAANTARVTAHPTVPSRSIIWYNDYCVYCDSRTRTKWWAQQVITKGNVAKVEHRHCEAVTLDYSLPRVSAKSQRLVVEFLEPPTCHCRNKQIICHHCRYLNIWRVFHQYVTFLTEMYGTVTVLSGVLFAPDENDYEDEEDENDAFDSNCYTNFPTPEQTPTHFFKVITCINDDRSYRLECFKFKNQASAAGLPNLRSYTVPREQLEVDAGFLIHENIHEDQIRDQTPHPHFAVK